MKQYKIVWALLASSLLLLLSCRKESPTAINPEHEAYFSSWDGVFESFWTGMNYSYSFWDIDPTDWDAVYRAYKPRFQGLEFGNSQDSITVKKLFAAMTANLIDHHYNILLLDNGQGWAQFSPGFEEVKSRTYYHKVFTETELAHTISVNQNKGRITSLKTSETDGMCLYSYCIDNSIAYFRIQSFNINVNMGDPDVAATLQNYYQLIANIPNLEGIVIDTRSNYGGLLDDLALVVDPLITKDLTIGYTRTKNGMGRLDYTPWSPMVVYTSGIKDSDTKTFEHIPIVSLVDVHSVSMAELTPMAIRALPNGRIVGERTWGGHGPLDGVFPSHYAGKFGNSAFRVTTSTSLTKNIDGTIYEGVGLTPDIEALYNEVEFRKGNDTQLERAIRYIKTGK